MSKAKEIILTGDLYDVTELEKYGFVNQVVSRGDLEEAVAQILERLIGHSKLAIQSQKRLFELWQNAGLQTAVESSVNEFALIFGAQETQDMLEQYMRGHR